MSTDSPIQETPESRIMESIKSDYKDPTLWLNSKDDITSVLASLAQQTHNVIPFEIPTGMATSIWNSKYSRLKENGEYQDWSERVLEVVNGNFMLDQNTFSSEDYVDTLRLAKLGVMPFSGRHLQHGDEFQPQKKGEIYTNCSTSMFSFIKFLLLLKGSGVGRDYSSDMCFVNWDNTPNVRLVLDSAHPDYTREFESLRDAQHKYDSNSEGVRWFTVGDSAEGWVKVIEILETAAFHGHNRDKMFIFDFSEVREEGQPISGAQGRPSSGPIPFMAAIKDMLTIKNSGMSPWKQAMFVDHYLSSCVAIGGIRRAARIACKFWKDKDIIEFIDIKRGGHLWSANNSVLVDAQFWTEANSPKPSHGRRVFEAMCSASYFDKTGEPAFINVDKLTSNSKGLEKLTAKEFFSENWRKALDLHKKTDEMIEYHIDRASKKKHQYIVNPCVTGDTLVDTDEGLMRVTDLVDSSWSINSKDFPITYIVNGERVKGSPFFSTGHKEVYHLVTEDGYKLKLTADHKVLANTYRARNLDGFATDAREWIEAQDLVEGDTIVINYNRNFTTPDPINMEDVSEELLTAMLVATSPEAVRTGEDTKAYLPSSPTCLPYTSSNRILDTNYYVPDSNGVVHFKLGLNTISIIEEALSHGVAPELEYIWSQCYPVETLDKGKRMDLGSIEASELYQVILLSLSKSSTILEDGTLLIHDLLVNNSKFKSLEPLGLDVVYDVVVPNVNAFSGNGIFSHNCGEIVLNSMGAYCVIGDLCLANVVDLEDAIKAAELMPQFLMRVNTMDMLYHAEVKRTNRIGVSITGIHEFAFTHFGVEWKDVSKYYNYLEAKKNCNGEGLPEDYEIPKAGVFEFWAFLDLLRTTAENASIAYAKKTGTEIPHTVTTIKPSGTISKIMGCTEGAHLPGYGTYLRWVQFSKNSQKVEIEDHVARGYPTMDLAGTGQYEDCIIIGFPTKQKIVDILGADKVVTAGQSTPLEQYQWLQLLERFWLGGDGVGNQASYTLHYNPDVVTYTEYMATLMENQSKVKCCSVMPQADESAYAYTPEQAITLEEYDEYMAKITESKVEAYDSDDLECENGVCPIEPDQNGVYNIEASIQ